MATGASSGGYTPPARPLKMVEVQCKNCGFLTKFTEESVTSDQMACYWCKSQAFEKIEPEAKYKRFESLDKAGVIPGYMKNIRPSV